MLAPHLDAVHEQLRATSLLLGAALGTLAMRYRAIGVAALAVFALVGGLVGARDPFTSPAQAWTTALAAGIAGAATLLLLLNAATQAGPSVAAAPPDPQEKRLGRRRFLQFAGGGLAAAAVSVPLGRRLRPAAYPSWPVPGRGRASRRGG